MPEIAYSVENKRLAVLYLSTAEGKAPKIRSGNEGRTQGSIQVLPPLGPPSRPKNGPGSASLERHDFAPSPLDPAPRCPNMQARPTDQRRLPAPVYGMRLTSVSQCHQVIHKTKHQTFELVTWVSSSAMTTAVSSACSRASALPPG